MSEQPASAETEVQVWPAVSPGRTGLGRLEGFHPVWAVEGLPATGVWTVPGSQTGEWVRRALSPPSGAGGQEAGSPHPSSGTTKQSPKTRLRIQRKHKVEGKVETRPGSLWVFCLPSREGLCSGDASPHLRGTASRAPQEEGRPAQASQGGRPALITSPSYLPALDRPPSDQGPTGPGFCRSL